MVGGGALLQAGAIVGEYAVLALLEQSDDLELYAAEERSRGMNVVLVCRAAGAQGVDQAELHEHVERLVRFRDPRVPATFGGGVHAGVAWVAVEPIEGTPLGEAKAGRPAVPLGVALCHFRALLNVLLEAERHGLRHGALRSSSVVLCSSMPELRVLGLGIAQALGRRVRVAADIWGAAALLYEMLTGAPPENPCAPISRVLRGVPRSLCALLDRALASDPRARYERLRDLALALDAVEREPIVRGEIKQALERSVTVFGMAPAEAEVSETKRHLPKVRARPRALERSGRAHRKIPLVPGLIAPDDRPPLATVVGERVGQELADLMEDVAFGEFLFSLIYLGMYRVPLESDPAGAPRAEGDHDERGAVERPDPPPPELDVQGLPLAAAGKVTPASEQTGDGALRPVTEPSVQPPSLAPSTPAGPSTLRSRLPQRPVGAPRSDRGHVDGGLGRVWLKRLGVGLAAATLVLAMFIVPRAVPLLQGEPQQALCVDLGRPAIFPPPEVAPVAPPPLPPPPPAPPSSASRPKHRPIPIPPPKNPAAPPPAEPALKAEPYVLDEDGHERPRSQ